MAAGLLAKFSRIKTKSTAEGARMEEFEKEAWELTKAQAGVRPMSPEELREFYETSLLLVKNIFSDSGSYQETPAESVAKKFLPLTYSGLPEDIKKNPLKSIGTKTVICLVCGKVGQSISNKHLASHGLTLEEYNIKFGLPANTKLLCKNLSKKRSATMKKMALWEKKKTALKLKRPLTVERQKELSDK